MPGWVRRVFLGIGILVLIAVSLLIFIHTPYAKQKIASYAQSYLLENYNLKASVASLDFKRRLSTRLPPIRCMSPTAVSATCALSPPSVPHYTIEELYTLSSTGFSGFFLPRLRRLTPGVRRRR